jgi:hypothetical protein
MSERQPVQVYLVGSRIRFENYCREHGVHYDGPYVHHVSKLAQIRGVDGGRVIFLNDWRTLDEGRAIYDYVIGRRLHAEDLS